MSRRAVRRERKAAAERDWAWQSERDDDQARDDIPQDEYDGVDRYAHDAQEFRS